VIRAAIATFCLALAAAPALAESPPAAAAPAPFACPRLATAGDFGRMALGRVHQGADGWFLRDADLTEDVSLSPAFFREARRFADALAARGVTLVLAPNIPRARWAGEALAAIDPLTVYDPARAAEGERAFAEAARAAGLAFVDLTAFPTPQAHGFKRDHHWTPEGAKAYAQTLAKTLLDLPALRDRPRGAYVTSVEATVPLASIMGRQLGGLCDVPLPPEMVTLYRTEADAQDAADLFGDAPAAEAPAGDAASGAQALFGDAGAPPIALAGSSFSGMPAFNFEGFLMEATGLAVANHSVIGGGPYAALESYVASDAFAAGPSPVLVWEFPRRLSTASEARIAFRRMTPAVHGVCPADRALARAAVTLRPNEPAILLPGEINAKGLYLAIEHQDPGLRDMLVSVEYANGEGEDVVLQRHERSPPTRRAFLALADDIPAPPTRIALTIRHARPVDATLSLCAAPAHPLP
jgi:alginate biosynthesis protein AlgX